MMTYEIFKAVVKDKFLSYLPEEYRDAEVDIRPVRKVNRTLDALSVLKDDSRMFSSMYVDELYEQYRNTVIWRWSSGQRHGNMHSQRRCLRNSSRKCLWA